MERLATQDVDVIFRKTGNHRLMTHSDLLLLLSELERMVKQYPVASTATASTQQQPNALSKL
jgi:hypothetical protein